MGFGFGGYDAFDYAKLEEDWFLMEMKSILSYEGYRGDSPFTDYQECVKKIETIIKRVLMVLDPYSGMADDIRYHIDRLVDNNNLEETEERLQAIKEKVENPKELHEESKEIAREVASHKALRGLAAISSLLGISMVNSFAYSMDRTSLIAETEGAFRKFDYKTFDENHRNFGEALEELKGYNPELDDEEFNEEYKKGLSKINHLYNKMGHCKKVIENEVLHPFMKVAESYGMPSVREHLNEHFGFDDVDEPKVNR